MPLINLKEMLAGAESGGYAVGMFDVVGTESLTAIIAGAEEMNSPVIIALAEVHLPYAPMDLIAPLMVNAARQAKVPVVVHLDHGISFDVIIKAMACGFTSVMFDGSVLPYEENIAGTAEVVKAAKALNISVEAELGHVGGNEGGGEDNHEAFYTDPGLAIDFVNRTGIDALAVAIGTVHGEYIKKPSLDLKRLEEINRSISTPLVLHGGSGLSDDDFRNCIRKGIRKINIFTDMSYAAAEGVRQVLEQNKKPHCYELSEASENSMKKVVIEKLKLFGSSFKA